MPTIDTILWQSVSDMTGGIITDVQSVLLSMVAIFFLMIGLDKLRDAFDMEMSRRDEISLRSELIKQRDIYTDERLSGTIDADIARARYRRALNRLSR